MCDQRDYDRRFVPDWPAHHPSFTNPLYARGNGIVAWSATLCTYLDHVGLRGLHKAVPLAVATGACRLRLADHEISCCMYKYITPLQILEVTMGSPSSAVVTLYEVISISVLA